MSQPERRARLVSSALFAGLIGAALLAAQCASPEGSEGEQGAGADVAALADDGWIPLFNGHDLTGWTPKIRGYPLGENFGSTFRVEDGVLRVAYDAYERFDERFGHLFYAVPYSHYRIRAEYRFTGEQVPGGPGWAFRNSGLMLHGQDPSTMTENQSFPVSIEVQLLGGDGANARTNANLCTPGTHVEQNGELVTRHCVGSASQTYHGDQWVTVEVEVRGDDSVVHYLEGQPVLAYQRPQLDPNDPDAARLIEAGALLPLGAGTISLQSESHPVEFRRVELLPLLP
ncbi:MAG: 3-keto-disaccharide hydrolase [Planctomycetota bacterium]|jgi:hypothetical protein